MKSLVHTEELCSRSVPLEHAPGAKCLVCIDLKITRYCMFENNRKDLTIIHSLIHSFIHAVDSIKPSDHKPVGSKRKEKDWKVNTSCRTVLQTH